MPASMTMPMPVSAKGDADGFIPASEATVSNHAEY